MNNSPEIKAKSDPVWIVKRLVAEQFEGSVNRDDMLFPNEFQLKHDAVKHQLEVMYNDTSQDLTTAATLEEKQEAAFNVAALQVAYSAYPYLYYTMVN